MSAAADKETGRRFLRIAAFAIAGLFVACAVIAVALARSRTLVPDFVDFWAAGRLTAAGHAASAYNVAVHHAVEAQAVPDVGTLPFPYPPFVLPFLAPFGLLPLWIGLGAWLVITIGLYLVQVRRLFPARFALAQAAGGANFITGQNGFLTSAIFIGGTNLLARSPFVAGAVLGLLCFKPQLAILLPVALLAGREWRAIAGGVLSALLLVGVGLLLYGTSAYRGFFANLPQYSQWLAAGRWPWGELASVFALLRYFGVAQGPALVVHSGIALAAAAVTAWAWALKLDHRVPVLAAATLLVAPYLFTYDGLLLTLPLAWLWRREGTAMTLAVWMFSLLPVISYFRPFPNTIPIAAMLALGTLVAAGRTPASAYQV